eukprot:6255630-Pyramimonas_sp.AAC.1
MEICTEPPAKALLDQELAEFKLPERLGEINDPPRPQDVRDLAVLGWNVRGVRGSRRRQQLLDDLRADFDARAILFQEWCVAGGAEQPFDGYVVH